MIRSTSLLLLLLLCLGDSVWGHECLCAVSDTVVRLAASHKGSVIDVLTEGSCVKHHKKIHQWAYISDTRVKEGYVLLSEHIVYKSCHECADCDSSSSHAGSEPQRRQQATVWGDWSDCSVTCGTGTQVRHCYHCPHTHHHTETRSCNMQNCPGLIQGSAHTCDKIDVLHALAEINTTSFTHCSDTWTSNTEDFLKSHCPGIPSDTNLWYKGISVATACSTTGQLPVYTPVGTFWNDTYQQDRLHKGYSGIFVACTKNGFKMATQACSGVPTILDIPYISGTNFTDDSKYPNLPSRYFTVRW